MKKVIALLLASLLAVCILSACGGNGNSTTDNNNSNNQTNELEKDLVSVEEIYMYSENDTNTNVAHKLRNLSGEYQDAIGISIQALDSNGDVLDEGGVMVENIDADQAKTQKWWFFQCNYDDIASLKAVSYHFLKSRGDGTYSTDKEYRFKTPIVFKFSRTDDSLLTPQNEPTYLWLPE